MWCTDKRFPAKPFSTPPPATVKSFPAMPLSERKSDSSSGCRRDLFHVVHKVPAGDSPYVRAKHVQLIDKDPSKAIPLFWAAINAGDRVDSALKDMAVVMKQLNRSDEAIEAIKSFRHLCPFESQESINNVLVELYKRSGRVEEEIEMLHQKLRVIDKGIAFGGKRTKLARSQGKKVQITVEQEKARILGNLAWAYLQHHDYGLAENFYRKSLALEPDNNKRCNLAICLMHMNRISEAKSLLQSVKASSGNREMEESYAKSFERAVQMLHEIDSKAALTQTGNADLHTQPRTVEGRGSDEDEMTKAFENVMSHTIRNLDSEFELDSAAPKPVAQMESCGLKKSTDIVEREQEWMAIVRGDVSPLMDDWNEEEFNDENRNSNIGHSRSQSVRRCLWFEGGSEKKKRLQVFRDITRSKDSP